jgi:23S rRNA (cytosine1962-C5)-methyltransferase
VELGGRVFLKRGRDGPMRGGNPWIFSQAIARTEPSNLMPGDGVEVLDSSGNLLGIGYYNPTTTIAVRILSFGAAEPEKTIEDRIAAAVALRERVIGPNTDCYRLVNGDGDGLSGIVVDRYADMLVIQLLTAGADRLREELVTHLRQRFAPCAILERSQGAVRRREGLNDVIATLAGKSPESVRTRESGLALEVNLTEGQKTGYFLDQRDNRSRIKAIAKDRRVLDAYCYAGGFALAALAGGAREVVAIDSSERALRWARRNLELNQFDNSRCDLLRAETMDYLKMANGDFDLVVIDPPPFARTAKDAERAGHKYIELNTLAMRALVPRGFLMTFSCSAHFAGEKFVAAVRTAQAKANRNFRMLERLGPGPDHPVLLGHPEGEYLTGLLLADLN